MADEAATSALLRALIVELRSQSGVVVDDDRWEDERHRSAKVYLSGEFDLELALDRALLATREG